MRPSRPALLGALAASALVALAGCGGSEPGRAGGPSTGPDATTITGTASGPATPGSVPATAEVRTIEISVKGKQVTPTPARVSIGPGQTLRLVVTSDHADQVHAHGFDVEKNLVAGEPTTLDLTGARPGLYEVETHHPPLRLLQVLVR